MARGLVRETAHFERPVTPLFATLVLPALERGFSRANAGTTRLELQVVDGYVYARLDTDAPPAAPDEDAPDLGTLADAWARELVPEVRALLEALRALAPPHATPRRLAAELDRIPALLERAFEAHYTVTRATQAGWRMLEDLLRSVGDPKPDLTVAVLLAPTDSLLREVDQALAELTARAARSPELTRAIGTARPHEAPALLAAHPATAEAFARAWQLVRDRPARMDLGAPTWEEDPAPLLSALQGGAGAREAFDAGATRALARRAEAEEAVRARLPPDAQPMLPVVLDMLRRARGVMQTVNFLVGEVAVGLARRACLRMGERLAAGGTLARAEDVMLLTHDEMRGALLDGFVEKGLVEARRASVAAAAEMSPPPTLGDVDEATMADPALAALLGAAPSTTPADAALGGLGASPGVAEGPVRLLRDEDDLARVQQGDVLVALSLQPSWTPAMLKAAAIVTESGGLLSHAAIVAREMGLPAVVGVRGALSRLQDGETIQVDGSSGALRWQRSMRE